MRSKTMRKKIATLLTLSSLITGCNDNTNSQKETSVFAKGNHVVKSYKRIQNINDLSGQLVVPEAYEYNHDLIVYNDILVYSFKNKEEVQVTGKRNSITGIVNYDNYGTPIKKKQPSLENSLEDEVEKTYAAHEHVLLNYRRVHTMNDLNKEIMIPEGYEYNGELIVNDGVLVYTTTNKVEITAKGKKNDLTGIMEYNTYGTPTAKGKQQLSNKTETDGNHSLEKIYFPQEHVLLNYRRINTMNDLNKEMVIPKGYEYNHDLVTYDKFLVYTTTNRVEVRTKGKKNSVTGITEYNTYGTPTAKGKQQLKPNKTDGNHSPEKIYSPQEHLLLNYRRVNSINDLSKEMVIPEGYDYNNDLVTYDDFLVYTTTNRVEVKTKGKKNSITGIIEYNTYGEPTKKESVDIVRGDYDSNLEKICNPDQHILMTYQRIETLNSLSGEMKIPEGYKYDMDLVLYFGTITYTLKNNTKVKVTGKKNEITGLIEYNYCGIPVKQENEQKQSEQQEDENQKSKTKSLQLDRH